MEEMRQSARIISQCLDHLPSGPIMAEAPQYIPPPELVMRHGKLDPSFHHLHPGH
jgi:NADH-quinone oxidoreductase subunit C/D